MLPKQGPEAGSSKHGEQDGGGRRDPQGGREGKEEEEEEPRAPAENRPRDYGLQPKGTGKKTKIWVFL